jgi:hypothetical protein
MSCLFNSLSYFLDNMNGKQLRRIIVDNMSRDPIIIEPKLKVSDIIKHEFRNMTLTNYIKKMSLSSEWGGAVEIKVFCELFHYKVNVIVLRTRKTIEFIPENNVKREVTITWNGSHYEPIKQFISPPRRK